MWGSVHNNRQPPVDVPPTERVLGVIAAFVTRPDGRRPAPNNAQARSASWMAEPPAIGERDSRRYLALRLVPTTGSARRADRTLGTLLAFAEVPAQGVDAVTRDLPVLTDLVGPFDIRVASIGDGEWISPVLDLDANARTGAVNVAFKPSGSILRHLWGKPIDVPGGRAVRVVYSVLSFDEGAFIRISQIRVWGRADEAPSGPGAEGEGP